MKKRPFSLNGKTYKISLPVGMLFVVVNLDEDGIHEVFLYMEKMGTHYATITEALGRLLSMALRSGIKVETIINQLEGIRSSEPVWWEGKQILSIPDGIAEVLKIELEELEEKNKQKKGKKMTNPETTNPETTTLEKAETLGRSGVLRHPTHSILDSSKIQVYMDCPRQYFFRYILGWDLATISNHLIFGDCWHKAMDMLYEFGYGKEAILEASNTFTSHYRKFFGAGTDLIFGAKTPGQASIALAKYAGTYAERDLEMKVLHSEVAGSVPISEEGDLLFFRIDKIVEDRDGGIWAIEHKTGSQNSRQWRDQWSMSMQVNLYTHVLYCTFPPDTVRGVKIDATFFKKSGTEFLRIPIRKSFDIINAWLVNSQEWVSNINLDYQLLEGFASKGDASMKPFKMNPRNCTKYFGCPYIDFCQFWANPLQRLEIPEGFETRWWDPRDREKEAKEVMRVKL